MAVLEHAGKLLVIDCGVLFPESEQPGVDLILPDFSSIASRLDDVVAIVLTHGHENHIGAVPYLLRLKHDILLIWSQLTLAFVEGTLAEHRIRACTHTVREGQSEQLGPFRCEFVAVNHSIPDALAVAVTTAAGTVVHTGDFTLDQLPLDGRITDLRAFARLADRGVDLLMVDSTNAEMSGFTMSGREITPVIDRIFSEARQRIVVACFASHVHRVQQVLDAAAAHGRKVAFVGRSMVRNMGLASALGYLTQPPGVVVDITVLDELGDERVVLVGTGSQGEPMAALSRIAHRDHRISVGPGDTVVLASSLIPGNETSVHRVIDGLTRLGATVVHNANATVHTSGHASEGELSFYNLIRPGNVMPVHGETRHLVANGRIAAATGVPRDRILLAEDGVVVHLVGGVARIVGQVPCAYVYVDGAGVGTITDADLKDRRILAEEGFISCFLVVDDRTGAVVAGPHLYARGFGEDGAAVAGVGATVAEAVAEAVGGAVNEVGEARPVDLVQLQQQVVRRTVGRWVDETYRRRPMIVPVVLSAATVPTAGAVAGV